MKNDPLSDAATSKIGQSALEMVLREMVLIMRSSMFNRSRSP